VGPAFFYCLATKNTKHSPQGHKEHKGQGLDEALGFNVIDVRLWRRGASLVWLRIQDRRELLRPECLLRSVTLRDSLSRSTFTKIGKSTLRKTPGSCVIAFTIVYVM